MIEQELEPRYICVHGHFYQPPRENPWLEEIERQESAGPFHDWNERITRESYAPNAFSRILDAEGCIVRIVNNYSRISFNFGPTLLSWMERKDPVTYEAILRADRTSQKRFSGHGSALAQAHGHMILPLASRRDKRTQILWGIRDFEHRFGRAPAGMWLPETAVDIESLDMMAQEGISFTILAPRQAAAVRDLGGQWMDVTGERVDSRRPYRVSVPSGGEITVFFYDGAMSRAVAFERLLVDGGNLAGRLLNGNSVPGSLTHIATDGETYGHHHRHGEMALSYALHLIEAVPEARLTNYAEYLERHPPTREARIVENSSWSCVHGVERWTEDCGCSTGDHTEWRQAWRRPLREALDLLRDDIAPAFEDAAAKLLEDPWRARDRYIEVMLDRSPESIARFLGEEAIRELSEDERVRVLQLLELQRHAMLMYTSCGWFFDDLARIETLQVLRYAARAIHLSEVLFGEGMDSAFLNRLASARSNVPGLGAGDELYRKRIAIERVNLARVAAHHAVLSLFNGHPDEPESVHRVYCYSVRVEESRRLTSGSVRLALGHLEVTSRITAKSDRFSYGVLHFGDHHLVGGVRPFTDQATYERLVTELVEEFNAGRSHEMIRILDREFRASTYSLHSLFQDDQERVINRILEAPLAEAESTMGDLYERRMPLMRFLAGLQILPPRAFRVAGEFILDTRLVRALDEPVPDIQGARELFAEALRTGLWVDREEVGLAAAGAAERVLERLAAAPENPERLAEARELADFVRSLPFPTDLWAAQNVYFQMIETVLPTQAARARDGEQAAQDWVEGFKAIGSELSIAVSVAMET